MQVVRKLLPEDLEQVCRIEEETFSLPWSYESFADTINREDTIYLAAEENGEILGYLGIWKSLEEGEITNVAVKSGFRGRGIGRSLLETAIEEAGRVGITALTLEVRISNKRAIHLYESMGFQNVGVRPGFYQKPKEDAVIMWKWKI